MEKELHTYSMSSQELQALIETTQISPLPDSALHHLMEGRTDIPSDAKDNLIEEKILDKTGKTPSIQWQEVINALAEPSWEIALLGGESTVAKPLEICRYYPLQEKDTYVKYCQKENDRHEISFYRTPEHILKEFIDSIQHTEARSPQSLELPFREFVALLALVDLYRTAYLESYIERHTEYRLKFTGDDLYYIFEKGLESNDFRWCVTLGRIFSPQDLFLIRQRLDDVLRDLEKRQLLKADPSQAEEPIYTTTAEGEKLCLGLRNITSYSIFKARNLRTTRKRYSLSILNSISGGAQFNFNETSGNLYVAISSPQIAPISRFAEKVLEKIKESLEVPREHKRNTCVKCGQVVVGEEHFCSFCGTAVASASPLPGHEKEQEQVQALEQVQEQEQEQVQEQEQEQEQEQVQALEQEQEQTQEQVQEQVQVQEQAPEQEKAPEHEQVIEQEQAPEQEKSSGEQTEQPRLCPHCSSKNLSEAHFCKECGKKLSSDTMKTCPQCSKQVKKPCQFCRFCGFNFTQAVPHVSSPQKDSSSRLFTPKEKEKIESKAPVKLCPQCNKPARNESKFCRFCGHNF